MRKYIWGFPRIGKSNLNVAGLSIVDADCRLFEFKHVKTEDLHTEERLSYERDEAYPANYLKYITSLAADIVLINCHIGLLEHLNNEDVLIVYPSVELMSEYQQRFVTRGDNDSFVSYMASEAPGMIDYIESTGYEKYKVLSNDTYLSDLFERNDFKMKLMTRSELTSQIQRAKDLDVIGLREDGKTLECALRFLDDSSVYGISAENLAEAVFDGKYLLDIDELEKVCSQREAEIKKEKVFTERRGGLSREELEDKIMQGIVNGALGIRYSEIAPYSHGYEVTFGGEGPVGSTYKFKNRWECYCDLFEIPGNIVSKIENDSQNNEVFGDKTKPLDIHELLRAVDEMEGKQIASFTPEKNTNFERHNYLHNIGSVASVMDVHAGKGLDGIAQHHYHGTYSTMTPVKQNELVESLVFLKGFCLDCFYEQNLRNYNGIRPDDCKGIVEYLKKHGTDISTPEKLQEWIKANPDKCGKEENRIVKQQFNEGHNLYSQAYCDFIELKSIVNNFNGSFTELCKMLGGDRYDDDIFRVEYGVLVTSISRDNDEFFLCESAIGIWDEALDDFLEDCVSFKYIKETCEEIGFDINELETKALAKSKDGCLSLDEQIADSEAKKVDGKIAFEKTKEKGEER